nr:hypothetical protein [Kitasatospora sp. NRRL B-11411]
MAVKKNWTVEHDCGHAVDHDLSSRPADKRAGYARWLATRSCRDCWLAERKEDTAEREAWIAARRAEEQEAATTWAAQFGMPPLEGPERAIAWGERCRHQLVTTAYQALVVEGTITEEAWLAVEEQLRTLDKASWWIDQRESEPADLPELAAAATSADRVTENPN